MAKSNDYHRFRRAKLWTADPRCSFCGVVTTLPLPEPMKGKPPENLATLFHLRSKWNPMRTATNPLWEPRTVLACHKCADEQSRQDQAKVAVDEIRQRCGNFPATGEKVAEMAKKYGDARRCLLDFYKLQLPIANGQCVYCGGHRFWSFDGRAKPCENERCITHRIEQVLGQGPLTWATPKARV